MSDFSRDPNDYRLSAHAMQRRRERDVPLDAIAKAIESGEKAERKGPGTRLRVDWGALKIWIAISPEDGVVKSCGMV